MYSLARLRYAGEEFDWVIWAHTDYIEYPSHSARVRHTCASMTMLNMLSRPALHAYLIGGIMSRAYRP